MSAGDHNDPFERFRKAADEGLRGLYAEIVENPAMRKSIARAAGKVMENKQAFDRGMETVLDFTGIPSKRDVRELKTRIDFLSSQLLNLNLKIDRIADKVERTSRPKREPKSASVGSKTNTGRNRDKPGK
jgi:hypothetical protein